MKVEASLTPIPAMTAAIKSIRENKIAEAESVLICALRQAEMVAGDLESRDKARALLGTGYNEESYIPSDEEFVPCPRCRGTGLREIWTLAMETTFGASLIMARRMGCDFNLNELGKKKLETAVENLRKVTRIQMKKEKKK